MAASSGRLGPILTPWAAARDGAAGFVRGLNPENVCTPARQPNQGARLRARALRAAGQGLRVGDDAGLDDGHARLHRPEQFLGKEANAQSDVFSLGIMVFEAIAGEMPFPGRTVGLATSVFVRAA